MTEKTVVAFPGAPPVQGTDWSVLCDGVSVEGRGRPIILDVSCRMSFSGITAIMGPNGAGKSVLLKTVAGLMQPSAGCVHIHPAIAGKSAIVFQKPVLLRRSVRANLEHALRIASKNRPARQERLTALLDVAGLTCLASRSARSLSGGEQQRLQISRALASDPRLLLLDEPTASLDPRATLAIEALVQATAADGVKIVLVTHDIGQAKRIADEVLFIHNGALAEHGPAKVMLESPKTARVTAYLEGRLEL